jgi:hypothetical protein
MADDIGISYNKQESWSNGCPTSLRSGTWRPGRREFGAG